MSLTRIHSQGMAKGKSKKSKKYKQPKNTLPSTEREITPWKLNLDILLYLAFNFLAGADFWAVMHSCDVLYSAGVSRYIFQQGTIAISERKHLVSFWQFLSGKGRTGYLALQGFRFLGMPGPDEENNALCNILKKSINMKELELSTLALLTRGDGKTASVAALKHLESITIRGPYHQRCVAILSSLRSPIVKVDLSFGFRDPVPLLANFRDSLEVIDCTCMTFRDPGISKQLIYPKVECFVIIDCRLPRLSALKTSFPNLRRLSIDNEVDVHNEDPEEEMRLSIEREKLRKVNQDFQKTKSWDTLDFFSADLHRLYMLALRCKVNHFWLSGPFWYHEEDIYWFTSSLALMRPTRLGFVLLTRLFPPRHLLEILSIGTEEVRRLDITLAIESPGSDDVDPEDALVPEEALDEIFRAIRILDLTTLDVKLKWDPEMLYECERISAAKTWIEQVSFRTLAEKALEAVPTLRLIVFETSCPEKREEYFVINPDTKTIEEIPEWPEDGKLSSDEREISKDERNDRRLLP
ncbi:hypothetical protein EIP86_007100 [Pleurotus ostreatoroseus]|nr:hypothetical protein EIP86_007100 [Pleurotus ostreatoroseus]